MERRRLQAREDVDLPDDVLADVLRRLPPRWLAASRCVRKAWRSIIDERGLLRADQLPLSLAGIFIQFEEHAFPEFFARPSSSHVNTKLDFMPPVVSPSTEIEDGFDEGYFVHGHCNGLLLLNNYVVNPATEGRHLLPPCPDHDPMGIARCFNSYIAFDPTISPHYQVFSIPYLHETHVYEGMARNGTVQVDLIVEKSEWPPSACIMNVFSSTSDSWEERSFAREGAVVGSIAQMRQGWPSHGGVYCRRALYVYRQTIFVMRISLTDDMYRVIKAPLNALGYLGRSKKGVYFASTSGDGLKVWNLDESCGEMKWVLKGQYDLKPVRAFNRPVHGPWVLQDINYEFFRCQLPEVNKKALGEEEFEWDSDNDDVVDNMDMVQEGHNLCNILGFHPFKEILFLGSFRGEEWMATVHAYHLNSSRVECLGDTCPTHYDSFEPSCTQVRYYTYFPYTPCWMGEFPSNL